MISATALGQEGMLPVLIPGMSVTQPAPGPLLPGADLLPPSVGRKLTIKNALIGGGIAVGVYLAWVLLLPPKKKAATAAAAVAGLFGIRRRRRRR